MSVYQRKNGKWAALLPNSMGRKYLGTYDTREEAVAVRDAAVMELQMRGFSTDERMTLEKLRVIFFKHRELMGVRGIKQEINRWSAYISSWQLYRVPIDSISQRDVRQWRDSLLARKLANQTVKNALNLLRAAMSFAVENDWLSANVARDVAVTRRQSRTEHGWTFLNPDEQSRLMAVASPADRALIAFALGTGLRLGEQLALRRQDVHSDHIVVRFGSPGRPTKSGHIREVPLFGLSADVARELADGQSVTLFGPRGRIQSRVWKKYLSAAGITRRVRWHDLRHTCATAMIHGWFGVKFSLEDVRVMLGHSSIKVTERYAHLTTESLYKKAMELQPIASRVSASGQSRTADQRFRNAPSSQDSADFAGNGCNVLQLATDVLNAIASGSPTAMSLSVRLAECVLDSAIQSRKKTG